MRVLFLDIDGVIESGQKRFDHSDEEIWELCRKYTDAFGDFDYTKWVGSEQSSSFWALAAVTWDWHQDALVELKRLLQATSAKIVLSSTRREFGEKAMRALFKIHGLDTYYVDNTLLNPYFLADNRENWRKEKRWNDALSTLRCTVARTRNYRWMDERSFVIREYLDRHPEITSYAAVDDLCLTNFLEGHFVRVCMLKPENADALIDILKKDDGPFPLPDDIRAMPELAVIREHLKPQGSDTSSM